MSLQKLFGTAVAVEYRLSDLIRLKLAAVYARLPDVEPRLTPRLFRFGASYRF